MFTDRVEAGRRLARQLEHLSTANPVILGLPRGGVPVAYEVARALQAPLDVILVRKLGVPTHRELAFGAIGEGGVRIVHDRIVRQSRTDRESLARVEETEEAELRRQAERFRRGRPRLALKGRTAVVVDDGIATGATASVACRVAKAQGADRVVLAVPVAPPDAVAALRADVDDLVCVSTPSAFFAVGEWYEDFSQTTDAEVVDLLSRHTVPGEPAEPHEPDEPAGSAGPAGPARSAGPAEPPAPGQPGDLVEPAAPEDPPAATPGPAATSGPAVTRPRRAAAPGGGAPAGAARPPAAPRAVEVEIPVPADGVRLTGDLCVPYGAPGVVAFAHGSGSSRHSPRNRAVAAALNEAGLGTLLFDLLTPDEELDRANVFDVPTLARRLTEAIRRLRQERRVPVGCFGASTGAAAALWAAAREGPEHAGVGAVVSRGGRPDLAGPRLAEVRAPTLLIVGGRDETVLDLNRAARARLTCPNRLAVVPGATHLFEEPGALDAVSALARDWFLQHLEAHAGSSAMTR